MKTQIVKIGNSQGVRIPKVILEQSGLSGEVELEVVKGSITIRASKKARAGWADAFKTMAEQGDDALLDEHLNDIPTEEWEW